MDTFVVIVCPLDPDSSDFGDVCALYAPFLHQLTIQSSLFERGCPGLVVICVARKLRPCPGYSRRRDRINLGLWRSLYKGGGGTSVMDRGVAMCTVRRSCGPSPPLPSPPLPSPPLPSPPFPLDAPAGLPSPYKSRVSHAADAPWPASMKAVAVQPPHMTATAPFGMRSSTTDALIDARSTQCRSLGAPGRSQKSRIMADWATPRFPYSTPPPLLCRGGVWSIVVGAPQAPGTFLFCTTPHPALGSSSGRFHPTYVVRLASATR